MDELDHASSSNSDPDMKKKKQKLDDSVDDTEKIEEEKRRYRSMATVAIAYGLNPLTKDSGISEIMQTAYSSFTIDTPKLEKTVFEMYEEGKEKVKKLLKDAQGNLTLSYEWMVLEDWTSEAIEGPILHEDFIAISVYLADEDFKVTKWILAYHPRESLGVKDTYLDPLKNVISDYEIESKVSTLLVPNYDAFGVEVCDDFRKWIEDRGGNEINPRVFLIYCCSDVLRLTVDDMFKVISICLVDQVRILLGWRAMMVTTKWDITLRNLPKAVDMEAKDVFEEEAYDHYNHPTEEEWIMIRTFCKLTSCIYKVAKELFEGEYPTSNVYFHLLVELKFMLKEELKNGDNEYFLNKANEILERFDKYWNSMFLVLATASVLDPQFKMNYLDFYCLKNEVNDEGSRAETVLDYMLAMQQAISVHNQKAWMLQLNPNYDAFKFLFEDEEEEEEEEEKKPDAYEDFSFFQEYLKFEGSSREFDEAELDTYLKEPVLEWKKGFNALEWWRKESQKYPVLSRVARGILSIPVSRGTSHRAYIANKRYCPDFVVSMEAKLVNAMMCSQSWPRF